MQLPKKKIVLVDGSPRKNGNSDLLVRAAAEGIASRDISQEIIFLRDYQYQPCLGCEQCRNDKTCSRLHDGMTLLYPKITEAGGLILASPTHNYNVTSWMKSFIDRLYCYYDFEDDRPRSWSSRLADQHRKAAVIGICEQIDKKDMGFVIEAMERPLEALGYDVVATQRVYGIFDRGGVGRRPEAVEEAFLLGVRLAEALSLHQI